MEHLENAFLSLHPCHIDRNLTQGIAVADRKDLTGAAAAKRILASEVEIALTAELVPIRTHETLGAMNADTRNAELAHDLLLAGASSSLHLALNQVLLGNNFNVLAKHTGRSLYDAVGAPTSHTCLYARKIAALYEEENMRCLALFVFRRKASSGYDMGNRVPNKKEIAGLWNLQRSGPSSEGASSEALQALKHFLGRAEEDDDKPGLKEARRLVLQILTGQFFIADLWDKVEQAKWRTMSLTVALHLREKTAAEQSAAAEAQRAQEIAAAVDVDQGSPDAAVNIEIPRQTVLMEGSESWSMLLEEDGALPNAVIVSATNMRLGSSDNRDREEVASASFSACPMYKNTVVLNRFKVSKTYRRHGIGSELMKALYSTHWKGQYVRVWNATPDGRKFYLALGFEVCTAVGLEGELWHREDTHHWPEVRFANSEKRRSEKRQYADLDSDPDLDSEAEEEKEELSTAYEGEEDDSNMREVDVSTGVVDAVQEPEEVLDLDELDRTIIQHSNTAATITGKVQAMEAELRQLQRELRYEMQQVYLLDGARKRARIHHDKSLLQ